MMARLAFVILFEVSPPLPGRNAQHAVFVLKFLFERIIPDVPYYIQLAVKREEYAGKLALEMTLYGPDDRIDGP